MHIQLKVVSQVSAISDYVSTHSEGATVDICYAMIELDSC